MFLLRSLVADLLKSGSRAQLGHDLKRDGA